MIKTMRGISEAFNIEAPVARAELWLSGLQLTKTTINSVAIWKIYEQYIMDSMYGMYSMYIIWIVNSMASKQLKSIEWVERPIMVK